MESVASIIDVEFLLPDLGEGPVSCAKDFIGMIGAACVALRIGPQLGLSFGREKRSPCRHAIRIRLAFCEKRQAERFQEWSGKVEERTENNDIDWARSSIPKRQADEIRMHAIRMMRHERTRMTVRDCVCEALGPMHPRWSIEPHVVRAARAGVVMRAAWTLAGVAAA